jgi:hypothetical protein
VIVLVVAFAGGEDGHDEVLGCPLDRPRRDLQPRERCPDEHASTPQILPDRELLLAEAALEIGDVLLADAQNDRDRFHQATSCRLS